jgi:hypothetical protein
METPLTLKIIEAFEMRKVSFKPDHDDAGYRFTLPCGHDVEGFFMLNGESCETESLEGLDGWLYIDTKEELDLIMKMTSEEELFEFIENNNSEFDRAEFE